MLLTLSKRQSFSLAIGVIILFFFSIFFLSTRKPSVQTAPNISEFNISNNTKEQDLKQDETESPFMLKDFHRSEIKNGEKIWEVTAKKGQYFPAENSAKLFDAIVKYYKEKGHTVELTANEATVFFSAGGLSKAEAKDNVRVIYDSEYIIETNLAYFNSEKNTVDAPGKVKFLSKKLILSGEDFSLDIDKKKFLMKKNVKSIINPKTE